MSMHIIPNFPSFKGNHCASTALREISHYYNNPLSESMVFGISNGLFFSYFPFNNAFAKLINVRNPILEIGFFMNLGMTWKWNYSDSLDMMQIKEYLDNNIPVLFQADTYYLDFIPGTGTNIAAHTLTVIGYTEKSIIISDFVSEKLQEIPVKIFMRAINSKKAPFYKRNVWGTVEHFEVNLSQDLILHSMEKNANKMLQKESQYYGLESIKKLYEEIEYWVNLPDWDEICTLTYLMLEKIGSGGSGFRKLYGQFIVEAVAYIPAIKQLEIINRIEEITKYYKRVSRLFFKAGKYKEKKILPKIKEELIQIYSLESTFWNEIHRFTNELMNESEKASNFILR